MTKFRESLLGPTVVLLAICLVITFALAGTYTVTKPIIKQSEINAANAVRQLVLPQGDAFTQLTGLTLPEGVEEVYAADNGTGYVIRAGAKGFDGVVTYMVGLDKEGNYTGINMFDHNETPGLGTKVANPDYLKQYEGSNNPDAVDGITGATRTSTALKNTLRLVNETYELVKEAA